MSFVVLDTHALLWFLLGSPRLSATALNTIESRIASNQPLHVCSISLVEIAYLVEKGRISAEGLARVWRTLEIEEYGLRLIPLDEKVARSVMRVPRDKVRDLPDRVITATALTLSAAIITTDSAISAFYPNVVW